MNERPTPRPEARIIPLRLISQATLRSAEAAVLFRTGTRTIRPIEAVLLSPILVPLTVIVLLLLLAGSCCWLAAVGLLVTVNLIRDLTRAVWRLTARCCARLDRRRDRAPRRDLVARLQAIYHIRCDAKAIDARAQAIAVEQSVEMPLAAIDDEYVLSEIVGRVEDVREIAAGLFEARISLSAATVGRDAGQLINMLFGNTSIHDDVVLHDAEFPDELAATSAARGTASTACAGASAPASAR